MRYCNARICVKKDFFRNNPFICCIDCKKKCDYPCMRIDECYRRSSKNGRTEILAILDSVPIKVIRKVIAAANRSDSDCIHSTVCEVLHDWQRIRLPRHDGCSDCRLYYNKRCLLLKIGSACKGTEMSQIEYTIKVCNWIINRKQRRR